MRKLTFLLGLSLCIIMIFAFAGCDKDHLVVDNQNAPDKDKALATPADLMSLVAGAYNDFWGVTQYSYPSMAMSTAGDEITSSWGNWHMRNASWEPRFEYDNSPSYSYNNFTETPWYDCYKAISSANDGLKALADGMLFGDNGADNGMVETFAKFVQGISHGFLACFFDQAFIFDETVNLETDALELQPYTAVMDGALAMLEDALALANANDFVLPDNWINGIAMTNEYMAELIHSYIARYMVWVARTPADRAAVNWATVMNHCNAGITEDLILTGDNDNWWTRLQGHTHHPVWCRVDNNAIGPADTVGAYDAWLATPLMDRMHFGITTGDRRITGDGGPESDGTDMIYSGTPNHRPDRGTYHFSAYTFQRYPHYDLSYTGPMTAFKVTELDMLVAEGLLRTGGSAATIAELINRTRVNRGMLPPATGGEAVGSSTDPHWIGTTANPATLWSMMKHEKFIENFCVTAGTGYFERRGWGELISLTPLHWPVPGLELEILLMDIYTHGGATGDVAAKRVVEEKYPSVH